MQRFLAVQFSTIFVPPSTSYRSLGKENILLLEGETRIIYVRGALLPLGMMGETSRGGEDVPLAITLFDSTSKRFGYRPSATTICWNRSTPLP